MFGGLNSYPIYRQAGFLSSLKKINLGSILTNTQKTLNIVNQAIPLVYQVKPIVDNAKTMFKIMGAVKNKMDVVFVPSENYEEAINTKKDNNYDIEIISIETFNDVINYLNNYKK